MKPDYTGISPIDDLSEIFPLLYQGKRPPTYKGYGLVVSCEEFLAKRPMDGFTGVVIHVPMRDEDEFKINSYAVEAAASAASQAILWGEKVLVHCSGGLNRSSVVTAQILYRDPFCMNPAEAVAHIRETRDEWCLCNRAFERWVLKDELPTAETSIFRTDATFE